MPVTSTTAPTRRRRRAVLAAAAASALLLAACGGGGSQVPGADGTLSLATGGTGGVYYPYGGGIANVISQHVEGYEATVQETNASVDNMLLIQEGAADLALGLGSVVASAVNGTGSFEGNPIPICALGSLYPGYTQAVTTAGTGIQTIEDLRGKRVSIGAPNSATAVLARHILQAAGIDPDTDIQPSQLGVAETVQALRDGTVDAGFWNGGLPTGALVRLSSISNMELIPTAKYADELAQRYGEYYQADEIPAGTYQGQEQSVPVVVVPNVLVVREDTPRDLQQAITRAIFEHKQQLVTVHPAAKELDASAAGDLGFIETCPGAQAYYEQAAG
jgi:TRAP transporter TAXI family solute receptor